MLAVRTTGTRSPVTVFFDATPLALWEQDTIHRAGIGRMATQTLNALQRRDDVRLRLLCPDGGEAYVRRYLDTHLRPLKDSSAFIPFGDTRRPQRIDRFKGIARRLLSHLPGEVQGKLKQLLGSRPFAAYSRPHARLRQAVLEHMPATRKRAVWFSCFPPIPLAVTDIPGLEKHVILHDIIPLRLPGKHPFRAPCLDLMRQHMEKADVIWANSDFTRRDFLDFFPDAPASRVRVALHGGGENLVVPQPKIASDVRAAYGLTNCPYFVSLGTLEPRKGLERLLRAFARVVSRRPKVHLVLIGQTGWDYTSITRLGTAGQQVHMTGYIPDAEVAAMLNGCTGMVYMSEYEGFGLPVVEAMACGAPVITADNTALPEVAGDAAVLVADHDDEALTAAMLQILDDEEFADELRRRGKERARLFTWDAFVDTVLVP